MHLTRNELVVVNTLRARRQVRIEQFVELLWGDRPDGGPTDAASNVRVLMCKLRRKGFRIEAAYGQGYRLRVDPCRALLEGERWLEVA
jgi:DNA-binding response OmpR family regulator